MATQGAAKVQAIADAWKRSTEAARAAGEAVRTEQQSQPTTETKG